MNKDFVKCQSAIIWLYPIGKEKPQKVTELLGSLQIFFLDEVKTGWQEERLELGINARCNET